MTLAEITEAVQQILNDPNGLIYTDAMVENWAGLAAIDISAKAHAYQDHEAIYLPTTDLSTELNLLADVTLSGVPRVIKTDSLYVKCYPTKSGSETPGADPEAWKTYNDTTLSGVPQRIGFRHGGYLYWTKAYPTAAAEAGATVDDLQNIVYSVVDDTVTGTPYVFRILTGGSYYYFKAYRIAATSVSDREIKFPAPADTLKILALARTVDAGSPVGMARIHPRQLYHLDRAAGAPRFFYDFGGYIGIAPVADTGLTLDCKRSMVTEDITALPDAVHPQAIFYALTMAKYMAGKFTEGAALYRRYLASVITARHLFTIDPGETKDQYRQPDRVVRAAPAPRRRPRR